jgi:hypothetical protein
MTDEVTQKVVEAAGGALASVEADAQKVAAVETQAVSFYAKAKAFVLAHQAAIEYVVGGLLALWLVHKLI